ncbi:glycerol-3-phosphate acyltransferase [Leptospira langatensis]|uniref:Glycerol-3-phosphate acyltransferase n=1 Tax=Leptospira langatensis TaxID=2484983 RepID=A0A5F1ZTM0_9LEPT|nr:1-acyl-sn-glycerol-3-phosphate acyltransferase [Leptospira langatensis]TGK03028.1 glycerol-3-phosphate acyltransferase [Leptospira langatensis]TGL41784.1 glycerol-3-phosphate acyltransferase [Leptospira langatensis]
MIDLEEAPSRYKNVAIFGGGPMGVHLSVSLSEKAENLYLWYFDKKNADRMQKDRSAEFLDDHVPLADNIRIVSDFEFLSEGSWIIIIAVPSRQTENVIDRISSVLSQNGEHTIVVFTKGLVSSSTRKKTNAITFSDYVLKVREIKDKLDLEYVAVAGPNLLSEMAKGKHSFFSIASSGERGSEVIEGLFSGPRNHIKTFEDIRALELVGVMKNPIAIACGILSGIPECGSNFEGELISLGFSEILDLLNALELPTKPAMEFGLADLITTATSRSSRNRAYGQRFIRKLISGEDSPNLLERIELFFNPKEFIQKEMSQSESHVEGAYSLSTILDLAEEKKVELPFYTTLFEVLTRKVSPTEMIRFVSKSTSDDIRNISRTARKRFGLTLASGKEFQQALRRRVLRHVHSQPGMADRILKQASLQIKSLEKRYSEAVETEAGTDLLLLPKEIKLWEEAEETYEKNHTRNLEKLVEFYVSEIADEYSPFFRESLIHLVAPARFAIGGFKPGSGLPKIGGQIKEIKALASRYDILYTPTHRSHLDSIEVAFGLRWLGLPVPRYAADKKVMATPGLARVLKSLGAYMVDRKRNRNLLYLECLTQYSTMMLEAGIPTLVYPEGTRSRTGGIIPIKTGILSTSVDAFKHTGSEVLVVPIVLSYENVPEDVEFAGKDVHLSYKDFLFKRTEVYMDLCEPIPVSRYIHEDDPTLSISMEISREWQAHHRILPNQLVAKLLLEAGGEINLADLEKMISERLLTRKGNYLTKDTAEILNRGIKVLLARKFIQREGNSIKALDNELLQYYANMVPDPT